MHDTTTIWQRVWRNWLRRLDKRAKWEEQVSLRILIRRHGKVEWVGRGENQGWTMTDRTNAIQLKGLMLEA